MNGVIGCCSVLFAPPHLHTNVPGSNPTTAFLMPSFFHVDEAAAAATAAAAVLGGREGEQKRKEVVTNHLRGRFVVVLRGTRSWDPRARVLTETWPPTPLATASILSFLPGCRAVVLQVVSLIQACLIFNPNERSSVRQLLNHPWLL